MNLKKALLTATACAALFVAPQAHAADGFNFSNWYVSASGGWDIMRDSSFSKTGQAGHFNNSDGWEGALAIGANITQNFSTELETSYHRNNLGKIFVNTKGSASEGGHISSWGFLVDGTWDFLPTYVVSPYITGGLGVAIDNTDMNSVPALTFTGGSGSDTVFAYKGGGGLNFHVADKTDLFVGYQYYGTSDAKNGAIKYSYGSNDIRGGIRFHF